MYENNNKQVEDAKIISRDVRPDGTRSWCFKKLARDQEKETCSIGYRCGASHQTFNDKVR